jgi:Skp family chaperone for outer membrane proteins
MKLNSWKHLLIVVFFAGSVATVQAQPKIGTVDLKKIFEGYFKTKQADITLKERAGDFEKTRKGMLDDYQSLNERYKKELEGANDQAVAVDEREKRKKTAENTLIEIKKVEQDITSFDRQARTTLGEHQRRMRDQVLKEIREVIMTKAKAGNFTLIVDTDAQSVNSTPIVLYTNGENELSDDILKQLNANAPTDSLKSSDTKDKGDAKEQKK